MKKNPMLRTILLSTVFALLAVVLLAPTASAYATVPAHRAAADIPEEFLADGGSSHGSDGGSGGGDGSIVFLHNGKAESVRDRIEKAFEDCCPEDIVLQIGEVQRVEVVLQIGEVQRVESVRDKIEKAFEDCSCPEVMSIRDRIEKAFEDCSCPEDIVLQIGEVQRVRSGKH